MNRGVPAAAVPHIKLVAEIYRHERDGNSRLTPGEVRRELEKLEKLVGELRRRLYDLPDGVDDAIAIAAHLAGRGDAKTRVRQELADFDQLLGNAWQRVEPRGGRPGSDRTGLAAEIAGALERSGVQPTAKPNGPLCQALGIVFGAIGEKGRGGRDEPNAVEIAKTALERRKNPLADP